jgi:hypothetical protein
MKEKSAHYEGVGAREASTEQQGEASEEAKLELTGEKRHVDGSRVRP